MLENYEATESGQFLFHDLITLVSENNLGWVFDYWAPDWISTEQFGVLENQALFDFDGELLDAIPHLKVQV